MKIIENGSITSPKGFTAAGVSAGIKKSGKKDIGIILSEVEASSAGVFTLNKMCAAPVTVCREVTLKPQVRAIVVNAGCANACTGEVGLANAWEMLNYSTKVLGLEEKEAYICSTGIIGETLPMDKIQSGILAASKELKKENADDFANAILTTDTFMKKVAYEFELDGKTVTIAGVAKGSGMIEPNMATMLTFITTDASVSPYLLKRTLKKVADNSFNMVVVDGDTSTNDSMIVLANGLAENKVIISETEANYKIFYEAFLKVAQDLAKMIAKDGEGATKFLEINVVGALTKEDAKLAAKAIAKSPLVKTAFFGEDPNWGRIVCAAGYSGAELNPKKISLHIGSLQLVANGLNLHFDKSEAVAIMKNNEIELNLDLGVGSATATVWTCDFSYDYVKINGEYHT